MNKTEKLDDRFMDELLREDAQGREVDEKLLAAVDAAIGGETDASMVTPLEARSSRAPYAWAAAITVSAASVLGYLGWRQSESPMDLAGMTEEAIMEAPRLEPERLRGMVAPQAPSAGLSALVAEGENRSGPGNVPGASVPHGDQEMDAVLAKGGKKGSSEEKDDALAGNARRESAIADKAAMGPLVSNEPTEESRLQPALQAPHDSPVVQGGERLSKVKAKKGAVAGKPRSLRGKDGDDHFGFDQGGLSGRRGAPPTSRERYGQLVEQPWKKPELGKFSTFSVDVDTASYTNIRRMLQQGVAISPDAVRIEECLNYFDYNYVAPTKGGPFAVHTQLATCPWAPDHHLMKVGIKGMEVPTHKRPTSNLVFLIDVSGSMQDSSKLPLLVDAMKVLVEELDERDRVSMVVYAGAEGVVLKPTTITEDGRGAVLSALNQLRSGGSTNGGAGIKRAYQLAQENFVKDGVNRVILATDGDFNVGTTGQGDLVRMVKERAKKGVFLSVLGFGSGNINDAMLEAITNDGNGNYFYIDSQKEGRKVFLNDLSGTLVTIAKDVKIQIDFNPAKVQGYRLIGYANRILRDEDFNNDKVDAGDIGAGHTVTALYEIVPVGVPMPPVGGVDASKYEQPAAAAPAVKPSNEWLTVKLRYKRPDGDKSTLLEVPVAGDPVAWEAAAGDFQFAAGVALFGMKLRESEYTNDAGWDLVRTLAKKGSARDLHGYRAEFLTLVNKAAGQDDPAPGGDPAPRRGLEAPPAE